MRFRFRHKKLIFYFVFFLLGRGGGDASETRRIEFRLEEGDER